MTIIEPVVNANLDTLPLTGDESHLALAWQQLDINYGLGRDEAGTGMVPHKHCDSGWTDYRPASPLHPIHLWAQSLADENRDRVERARHGADWSEVRYPTVPLSAKHFNVNTAAWYDCVTGANAALPKRALEANIELIEQRLRRMRFLDGDPLGFGSIHHVEGHTETPELQIDGFAIHIWPEFNPVYFESLVHAIGKGFVELEIVTLDPETGRTMVV